MDCASIIEAGKSGDISRFTSLLVNTPKSVDVLSYICRIGREILSHYASSNNHIRFEPMLRQLISTITTLINDSDSPDIVNCIGILDSIIIYKDNYYPEFLSIINSTMYEFLSTKYGEDGAIDYLRSRIHCGVRSLAFNNESNTPLLVMNKLLYGLPYGGYLNEASLIAMKDKDFLLNTLDEMYTIHERQLSIDSRQYTADLQKISSK